MPFAFQSETKGGYGGEPPFVVLKNFNDYSVINLTTGHILSKHTTLNKAKKQMEILKQIEPKFLK